MSSICDAKIMLMMEQEYGTVRFDMHKLSQVVDIYGYSEKLNKLKQEDRTEWQRVFNDIESFLNDNQVK